MRVIREYDNNDEFFHGLMGTVLLVEYAVERYDYHGRLPDELDSVVGKLVEVSSFPRYIVMEDSLSHERIKIHLDHILTVEIL